MSSTKDSFLKRHLWHISAIVLLVLILVLVALPRFRYTTVKGKDDLIYLVDNFTGKTRGLSGSEMFNIYPAEDVRRKSRLLSDEERRKISASMSYDTWHCVFMGDVYNGNDKIRVTSINIKIKTPIGTTTENLPYTINQEIDPHSVRRCMLSILRGDTDSKYYTWYIESAMGYDIDKAD